MTRGPGKPAHAHPNDAAADAATALVQASPRARAWLFGLVVLLPLGLVGLAELQGGNDAGAGPLLGVAAFCSLLCAVLARLLRRHRLRLDDAGLEVATTFYTRRFAWADLDLDQARVVELGERPEYRPMLRTNGMSLPGFRSGWYRLRNGNRALVATAGGTRLLRVPTRAGHDLVLEAGNAQVLLDRLRGMAAGTSSR